METAFDLTEASKHLGQAAQDVFAMMVGVELDPCVCSMATDRYNAMLLFRAPVRAALVMECEPKAAAVLTRRFLHLEKVPIGFNDDVHDCLGELVNMIGGNLRNFLPELQSLDATPNVWADRSDLPGEYGQHAVTFDTGFGYVRLSLH